MGLTEEELGKEGENWVPEKGEVQTRLSKNCYQT